MADRLAAFVVIALCVVALALTASTLSATSLEGGGSGDDAGPGADDTSETQRPIPNGSESAPVGVNPHVLVVAIGAVILLAVPAMAILRTERLSGLALGLLYVLVVVGIVALFTTSLSGGLLEGSNNGSLMGGGGASSAPDAGSTESETATSPLLFGVLGLAVVLAAGVVFLASASVESDVDVTEPEEPEEGMAEVGRAAGAAADHIAADAGDLSNGVYEAYHELTAALDVPNPETTTPGEFADAAVATGLDPERVGELTRLFEAVRYGDEPPSDERERRALDALRAIEADYADGEAGGVDFDGETGGGADFDGGTSAGATGGGGTADGGDGR